MSKETFKVAITALGGQVATAKALGVTQQAVSRWVTLGYAPVPAAGKICALSGVPLRSLVSDEVKAALVAADKPGMPRRAKKAAEVAALY